MSDTATLDSPTDRLIEDVRKTVLVGLLAGLLFVLDMWLTSRDYPLLPPISALAVPQSKLFDFIYLSALVVLWGCAYIDQKRNYLLAFIAWFLLGLAIDQVRWTPFFYQYLIMLIVIAAARPELDRREIAYDLRLILAGLYFWAGVQKANWKFVFGVFPWFIGNAFPWLEGISPLLGMAAPIIEAGLGLLLLSRFERQAAWAIIAMHLFILMCLGPLGHYYGISVWPWNLVMPILLWKISSSRLEVVRPRFGPRHLFVILAMFVLPFLNLFNLWDSNLSFHMYSGNLASTKVIFDSTAVAKTPPKLRPYLASAPKADAPDIREFSLIRWQLNSTSSVPYPEVRTYREVIRALCRKMPAETASHIHYSIEEKTGFLRQPWKTDGWCSDLVQNR